jgi:hypothetical protein
VTFLAAESGTRLTGITWHRDLLVDGEDDLINAETLLWHLDRGNAQRVQELFAAPLIRPFALLLAALRADRLGQGAAREATRRRAGLGAARRRTRETLPRHPDETGQAGYRTGRFSISRLVEGVPPAPRSPARSPQPRATWQEAVAVYIVLGYTTERRYPGAGRRLDARTLAQPVCASLDLSSPGFGGPATADQHAGRCNRRRARPGA